MEWKFFWHILHVDRVCYVQREMYGDLLLEFHSMYMYAYIYTYMYTHAQMNNKHLHAIKHMEYCECD